MDQQVTLENEAGFQVLFRCATIGILVINEEGGIELSNPCAESLFGYKPTELIGKAIEVLIPGNLRERHVNHREHYFDNPKSRPMGHGIDLYARRKNGEIFPVEISLGHYTLEDQKLAVAFITDISTQVQAKKIIAEKEAWFRNMADNSPVMIWSSGTDKLRNYFNNSWLEFTGRTLDQEAGSGWIDGVHPDDIERMLVAYYDAFDAVEPFINEYRLRRYDGHYRWIRAVGKPVFSPERKFTGFIGSCLDVHDQKVMHERLELLVEERTKELNDALHREQEMNELKSRFVSMASHEFRTPLSVVLSSTVLVGRYVEHMKEEKVTRHLQKIKAAVASLTSILTDFLSLDKLEQGNVEIECRAFDLSMFLADLVEDLKQLEKIGQNIQIIHKGESFVDLDPKKLRYVMINLLSNAIKYSGENSEIELTCEIASEHLTISVRDHGIGIPEEDQKFLFNKFFRAKNTGTLQGTGLGLTIVKRYVELMNGEITFQSITGQGTTFIVSLPRFYKSK